MSIMRNIVSEMNLADLLDKEIVIDNAVAHFDRQTEMAGIRTGIKKRYGIGIRLEKDPNVSNGKAIETYVKEKFSLQVDSGMIESIPMGFGQKVTLALASLFTEQGQKFTLTHENEDTNMEEAEALLNKHRENGGFDVATVEADEKSIQVGSCGLFMSFTSGGMNYQPMVPSAVRIWFGDTLIEDGKERSVDTTDIEDAFAVVLRLSMTNLNSYRYLAIVGSSVKYPNGRWVEYEADANNTAIPEVGDAGTLEFEIEGEPANPLSYYSNQNPELKSPEYPLAIIVGETKDNSTPMPTSTALYETDLEFSIAGSHTLSASQEAARGTTVVELNEQGKGQPLPRTLSGAIVSNPGQEVKHVSKNAADAKISMETLNMEMVAAGSGWGVADYMMVSEDHAIEASSGVALEIKTRPLRKRRNSRVKRNKRAVQRIFEIEKAYIGLFETEDSKGKALLMAATQTWAAGEITLPENKKEIADRIGSLIDKGIMDTIGGIREYYQLTSDEDAEAMYERMKERATEFPPLSNGAEKKPARTGNFFRGGQAGRGNTDG